MNGEVQKFVESHKEKLIGRVLEVGGIDVNGNLRHLFPDAVVTDMNAGRNVDVVCPAEKLIEQFGAESFDSVVSTEALEHMEKWRECLVNMWGVLKPNGWLVMTMAAYRKGYHGYPGDYIRLNVDEIVQIWPGAIAQFVPPVSVGWAVQKCGDFDPWTVEGKPPRK